MLCVAQPSLMLTADMMGCARSDRDGVQTTPLKADDSACMNHGNGSKSNYLYSFCIKKQIIQQTGRAAADGMHFAGPIDVISCDDKSIQLSEMISDGWITVNFFAFLCR